MEEGVSGGRNERMDLLLMDGLHQNGRVGGGRRAGDEVKARETQLRLFSPPIIHPSSSPLSHSPTPPPPPPGPGAENSPSIHLPLLPHVRSPYQSFNDTN